MPEGSPSGIVLLEAMGFEVFYGVTAQWQFQRTLEIAALISQVGEDVIFLGEQGFRHSPELLTTRVTCHPGRKKP